MTNGLTLLFGVSACTAAFATKIGGTPVRVQQLLNRLGGRRPRPVGAMRPATAEADSSGPSDVVVAAAGHPASGTGSEAASREGKKEGLEVRELSVFFGGTRAVSGVSLTAPMGEITGLIGPNGAGKTTIFNACSGLVRVARGQILLHSVDLRAHSPAERARRGLGRTFQRPELFNSLKVRDNVAMGCEAAIAGRNPVHQVFDSRLASRAISAVTEEALALTGTDRIADVQVGLLPIGQRRLVELATTLAGPFDLLLLDEPSSGLDGRETEAFGEVLHTVLRQREVGVFLVEHDMTLVREVCDRVYVLDFGSLIFHGSCEEMQQSAQVRAAYLGDTAALSASSSGPDLAAGPAASSE